MEMKRYKLGEYLDSFEDGIHGTLGNIAFYNGERIALGKSAFF